MKTLFIFLFIAIVSIPLGGYQFGYKEHFYFIPLINRSISPELYSNDYSYPHPHEGQSVLQPVLSFSHPYFPNIPIQFFFFYIFFHTIWMFAIFRFSKLLLGKDSLALFSLLFFVTPKFIGGTAGLTYDSQLLYRTAAIPFALLGLVFFFERKNNAFSILMISIAALMHPLWAFYSLIPIWVDLTWRFVSKYRAHFIFFAILCTLPFIAIVLSLYFFLDTPIVMDPTWKDIVMRRLPFAFLSRWDIQGWGNILFFAVLFLSSLFHLSRFSQKQAIFFPLLITTFLAFIVPLIGEIFSITALIQIQFARILILPLLISIILFSSFCLRIFSLFRSIPTLVLLALGIFAVEFPNPYLATLFVFVLCISFFPPGLRLIKNIYSHISSQPIRFTLFHLILTILIFHVAAIYFGIRRDPDPHFVIFPDVQNPWIDVQLWAKKNTPTNALFLYNPFLSGWRMFSERGSVVEYKDGAPSIFSQSFAREWKRRIEKTKNAQYFTEQELEKLREEIPFDYFVQSKEMPLLSLPLVYENVRFRIYALKE